MKEKNPWEPKAPHVEANFQSDLWKLLQRYFSLPFEAQMMSLPEWLDAWSAQIAQRMVTGIAATSARTWRMASRESMKGSLIHTALMQEMGGPVGDRMRELIAENAKLISSLPIEISRKVSSKLAERALAGERSEVSEAAIRKYTGHLAAWHVRLIARTETSKASTALTAARAEDLGLQYYIWKSSQDSRVRLSHRFMARNGGVICSFDNPPSPERLFGEKSNLGSYAPGNCPNCRCYPEVMLRLDQVKWPHRVFNGSSVLMMRLAAFRRFADLDRKQDRLGKVA
jgi:hypothetical protein